MFPAAHLEDLNRFACLVWGNPQALLRRLPPHGVEFIYLGEYFNIFRSLFPRILQHDKILVREEYRAVLQALQTHEYQRGAYVTGQPGIGKTYFLVYVLVHFLGKKQPVALQPLSDARIYLLFKDDIALYPVIDVALLLECSSLMWVLSVTNMHMHIPPGTADCIRVIQTPSSQASCYRRWSASRYIMDIWTEGEVEHLATLLGLNVKRMITLARKWGPIPRDLLQYIDQEDSKIETWYCQCSRKAVAQCSTFMEGGMLLDFPDPLSSFYIIRPYKNAVGISYYCDFSDVTVPTRTLHELLGKGLWGKSNRVKLEFYRSLSRRPETCQAARFIYESWFHSFVSAGNETQCQWVAQGSDDNTMVPQLPTTLRGTNIVDVIPSTQDTPLSHSPPFYWIPPLGYLPGIDSALVLEEEIFAFQVTIWSDHTTSPIKGLQKLRKISPDNLKDHSWRMVFVGVPEDASTRNIAQTWAPTQGTHVPVGWSAVDPVQDGVVYKAYRDESDPMLKEFIEEIIEFKGEC